MIIHVNKWLMKFCFITAIPKIKVLKIDSSVLAYKRDIKMSNLTFRKHFIRL